MVCNVLINNKVDQILGKVTALTSEEEAEISIWPLFGIESIKSVLQPL
ncbi:hypothetical protein GCM10028803_43890 [Larkinella knui]